MALGGRRKRATGFEPVASSLGSDKRRYEVVIGRRRGIAETVSVSRIEGSSRRPVHTVGFGISRAYTTGTRTTTILEAVG